MLKQVIWLFGKSGTGKTTLATALSNKINVPLLDADKIRLVLGIEPDFSLQGRLKFQKEFRKYIKNYDAQTVVVASITPLQEMRNKNRKEFKNYYEIYLHCSMDKLIARDPKRLYAKALRGDITNFTGLSSVFEKPYSNYPDLYIDTGNMSIDSSLKIVYDSLIKKYGKD